MFLASAFGVGISAATTYFPFGPRGSTVSGRQPKDVALKSISSIFAARFFYPAVRHTQSKRKRPASSEAVRQSAWPALAAHQHDRWSEGCRRDRRFPRGLAGCTRCPC